MRIKNYQEYLPKLANRFGVFAEWNSQFKMWRVSIDGVFQRSYTSHELHEILNFLESYNSTKKKENVDVNAN